MIFEPEVFVVNYGCYVYASNKEEAEQKVLSWISEAIRHTCPAGVSARVELMKMDRSSSEVKKLESKIHAGKEPKEVQMTAVEISLSDASKHALDSTWLMELLSDSSHAGVRRLYVIPGIPAYDGKKRIFASR